MKKVLVLSLLLAGAAGPASAQALTKLGELVLHSTQRVRGVEVADPYAICSFLEKATQRVVEVTDPWAPKLIGTAFVPYLGKLGGDQWNDAAHTPAFGGRLLIGHRYGGLTLVDASSPATGLRELARASTRYHFKGLRVVQERVACSLRCYVFYSDVPSSAGKGGLRIYEIRNTALVQLGSSLAVNRDAEGLALTSDRKWCFQISAKGAKPGGPTQLLVYNTSVLSSPQFVSTATTNLSKGINPNAHVMDLEISRDDATLLASMGYEGLHVIDVSTPTSPKDSSFFAVPGLYIEGLTPYNRPIVLLWGFLATTPRLAFLATLSVVDPKNPAITNVVFPGLDSIQDVNFHEGLAYVVGQDAAKRSVLQIWG